MDYLKRATVKQYTIWDLNCKPIYSPNNRQTMEHKIKRQARRKDRQNLRIFAEILNDYMAEGEQNVEY